VKLNRDDLVPFLSAEEIQAMVKKIARLIERDYDGQEVVLICPLKGSMHFSADLSRELQLPQEIDFVLLRSTQKKGMVQIQRDISVPLTDRHVLIVEEVIDAGRKVSFLMERIRLAKPASLKVVTLLDKPSRREIPFRPDYVGLSIEDRFVIGYGMDADELGRNFKDIYILTN
jgi:hypoxanthine phosphoribosyltransferase